MVLPQQSSRSPALPLLRIGVRSVGVDVGEQNGVERRDQIPDGDDVECAGGTSAGKTLRRGCQLAQAVEDSIDRLLLELGGNCSHRPRRSRHARLLSFAFVASTLSGRRARGAEIGGKA